jgi:hypothetical protein
MIRIVLSLLFSVPAILLFILLVPFICILFHLDPKKRPVRLFWRHVVLIKAGTGFKYTCTWED